MKLSQKVSVDDECFLYLVCDLDPLDSNIVVGGQVRRVVNFSVGAFAERGPAFVVFPNYFVVLN